MKQKVKFIDLGRIDFNDAWQLQSMHLQEMVSQKRKKLKDVTFAYKPKHQLLFCEHPPVYTLGRSGKLKHLKLDEKELKEKGIEFYKINRGGDITYHGPGQLVVYPNFDLDFFFNDLHQYIRLLEQSIIDLLAIYNIVGIRLAGMTGVWINDNAQFKKICAIGVHVSRWVTMHGLALNIDPELANFGHIIPCGISDENKSVTSIRYETGTAIAIETLKTELKAILAELFQFEYH